MAPAPFGALLEIQSHNPDPLRGPPRILPRDTISQPQPPTVLELDAIQWGERLNGPPKPDHSRCSTPQDLESSLPATPTGNQPVDAIVQTAVNPPINRWRLASAALMFFLVGVNDSATGALIPYLEQQYNIGYAIVSLIFISNALGFILAAPVVQPLENFLGRSRTYLVATVMLTLGYIALTCDPPFPVVVSSYLFIGFGAALFLAMTNAWVINLVNGTTLLGFMHGAYGVGGVVSPIMATAMVSKGVRWSFYYLIPLFFAVLNTLFMSISFWNFEKDSAVQLLTNLEQTASRRDTGVVAPKKGAILLRSLKNRTTLLGAIFIFGYQGAEVAISGWVISFLINYRKGDPAHVGNVTSGFWGGITLGRFILTYFCHKIGEKNAVYGLVVGAAVFQLLVWLIPNIIGNAVAEAMVGFLLGPIYPCATFIFSRLLPRNIQVTSLGFVGSVGSSGGALAPFFTGLLAQKLGTEVLHPICLGLFALMEVAWFALPRVDKRTE